MLTPVLGGQPLRQLVQAGRFGADELRVGPDPRVPHLDEEGRQGRHELPVILLLARREAGPQEVAQPARAHEVGNEVTVVDVARGRLDGAGQLQGVL